MEIDSTLYLKSIENEHPLRNLLERALDQYTVSSPSSDVPNILWPKERYQLDKSIFFNSIDKEIQNQILQHITELNLSLSAFIETSGHNYGAKMILMAETIEEKSLYALFTAEEAIHLKEFQNFMNFTPDPKTHWHPMLNPLASAIKEGEKNTCLYIIQVLLEGFGMAHYNGLKADCLYEPLQNTYDRILKDEARHHGTGLILSKESKLSKLENEQIFEYTREFIKSLQEANWVINTIEKFHKPMSKKELILFNEQTDKSNVLNFRLNKLKEMLSKVNQDLVKNLEKENIFKAIAS